MKVRKIFDAKYGVPFDEELIVLVGKDEFLKKNAARSGRLARGSEGGDAVLSRQAARGPPAPDRHQDGAGERRRLHDHEGLLSRSDVAASTPMRSSECRNSRSRRAFKKEGGHAIAGRSQLSAAMSAIGGTRGVDAAAGGEKSGQGLHGRRPQRHGDRPAVAVDRGARVRFHRRPVGLRQEHVPAHRRRLRARDRRRAAPERAADRTARPRSRHDVSGSVAVSLAHRHRECGVAAGDEEACQSASVSPRPRVSRSRSSVALRRSLSRPAERRHEAAGGAGAAVRARSRRSC